MAHSNGNWVHIEVAEVLRETDKAFKVRLEDGGEYWLPKSQISDADDYNEGDVNATMSITEWIAEQNEIES
jgi:hypothetical protein